MPRGCAKAGSRFPWPDTAISQLRRLWAMGLSAAQVGAEMGLTKDCIIGKAHRLRLSARAPSRPRGARVVDAADPEPIDVDIKIAAEWARDNGAFRTLAEVNQARAGFGLPPFRVVRR